jgi:hypothetical protein
MQRAILVTELEKAIIDRIRSSISCQAIVLNSLSLPETEAVRKYYERIMEKCFDEEYKKNSLEDHKKYAEERLKEYRAMGYNEPLEFGTGKAMPFLRALPSGQ